MCMWSEKTKSRNVGWTLYACNQAEGFGRTKYGTSILEEHEQELLEAWYDYFGD